MILLLVSLAALLTWLFLTGFQGGFWRLSEEDRELPPPGALAPGGVRVTAVIPARNEAEVIAQCIDSLLAQEFSGVLDVVLVDDESADGTGDIAREAAAARGAASRLTVLRTAGPPPGWTGKLAAMSQGFEHVRALLRQPDFVLFCDADIAFDPLALERLVTGALARKLVLTSLMVKLRCESLAEKLFVPSFVFFFQMLYPFPYVNDPKNATAAAAGGVMLVRPEALAAAGGLAAIRDALIDDCALAALLKRQGPIWLGLTQSVRSLRTYPGFADIEKMVARSAYAELDYSPLRLASVVISMIVVFMAPLAITLSGSVPAASLGLISYILMVRAYMPSLRYYGAPRALALALPLIAACYTWFTILSALQHRSGRGGAWKGRYQAPSTRSGDDERGRDGPLANSVGQDP